MDSVAALNEQIVMRFNVFCGTANTLGRLEGTLDGDRELVSSAGGLSARIFQSSVGNRAAMQA